jgi:DnaJ-class molecular chaperone
MFKRSFSALAKDYKYNKKYNLYYETLSINLNKKNIYPETGNMCSKCKGCGWITNNKKNNGFNFGYDICKICRGTGYL